MARVVHLLRVGTANSFAPEIVMPSGKGRSRKTLGRSVRTLLHEHPRADRIARRDPKSRKKPRRTS